MKDQFHLWSTLELNAIWSLFLWWHDAILDPFFVKSLLFLVSVINFMIDCRYLSSGPEALTLISCVAFFTRSPKNNSAKSCYEDRQWEEF